MSLRSPFKTVSRQRPLRTLAMTIFSALLALSACAPAPSTPPAPPAPTPTGQFNVEVRFLGSPTSAQRTIVNQVVDWWESTIVGDVEAKTFNFGAGQCLPTSPALKKTVDDFVIDVEITYIDGKDGILGQAGPCWTRPSDGLPSWGAIRIDSVDASNLVGSGYFDDVIIHELGHTLGFGTMWNAGRSLVTTTSTGAKYFNGANAKAQWQAIGGSSAGVPVETGGGAGTADVHWRENAMANEFMTGYISPSNIRSKVTIGSMADLGYKVSYVSAQGYSRPSAALQAGVNLTAEASGQEIPEHELTHDLPVRTLPSG